MGKMTLDWKEYFDTARQAAEEGIVLLKNDPAVLPLKKGSRVAVFGRIQLNYYRSGTGSGGMVNVSKVTGILDALLEETDIQVNQKLLQVYREFEEKYPFDAGCGWGTEPWSQKEMEVTEELCVETALESDTALVILGRTAGEDRDNQDLPGAYRLTETECRMLERVRKHFSRMAVLLNVGNIIDMSFVEQYRPDAVLYVWQGGMVGGYGAADVLMGRVSPSGKLTDTIARQISDYPSDCNFGAGMKEESATGAPEEENLPEQKKEASKEPGESEEKIEPEKQTEQEGPADIYQEDIYVGYRYFETAAREKVLYPFGFGLSYTQFSLEVTGFESEITDGAPAQGCIRLKVKVSNRGAMAGKEVVQIYVGCPQGTLGKPARVLVDFEKTASLRPGASEILEFTVPVAALASYDDGGFTGNPSCWVLEAGRYQLFAGTDVRSADLIGDIIIEETVVVKHLEEAMAPVRPFMRLSGAKPEREWTEEQWGRWKLTETPLRKADMEERRKSRLPHPIPYTGNKGIRLEDVEKGTHSMEDFVAQLSLEELCCMVRGEGMGSPKVTPGTAAAFGGVLPSLKKTYGIPCGCCDDGPSGMRLDCGDKAFSLPGGTMLACTFNRELNRRLFACLGIEMAKNKIDCLLGPGLNIHRHPLNGRNFEYFSEDPYLTGEIAAAQLQGMASAGVTGTVKHFCGNNQETARHQLDSVISERALREIYLKGFEIAVKKGGLTSVMTTYGKVNGQHTASLYDLTTTILRDEWGFCGIAMTDWWAQMNDTLDPESKKGNLAAMVRAQNDLYMVCPDSSKNIHGDDLEQSLERGTLTMGELQRCAGNICQFLLTTHAMERIRGEETVVEIQNCPQEEQLEQITEVEFHPVGKETVISLEQADTTKGTEYRFGLDMGELGGFTMEFTAKSDLGELAQIPVGFFFASVPVATLTWNGTKGQWVTKKVKFIATTRFSLFRLCFGQSGLTLRDLKVTYDRPASQIKDWDSYQDET